MTNHSETRVNVREMPISTLSCMLCMILEGNYITLARTWPTVDLHGVVHKFKLNFNETNG